MRRGSAQGVSTCMWFPCLQDSRSMRSTAAACAGCQHKVSAQAVNTRCQLRVSAQAASTRCQHRVSAHTCGFPCLQDSSSMRTASAQGVSTGANTRCQHRVSAQGFSTCMWFLACRTAAACTRGQHKASTSGVSTYRWFPCLQDSSCLHSMPALELSSRCQRWVSAQTASTRCQHRHVVSLPAGHQQHV